MLAWRGWLVSREGELFGPGVGAVGGANRRHGVGLAACLAGGRVGVGSLDRGRAWDRPQRSGGVTWDVVVDSWCIWSRGWSCAWCSAGAPPGHQARCGGRASGARVRSAERQPADRC